MKHTIATLCILGASLAGFSQDKHFDLSKYKFPDYKRHELELNFNSNGSSYKNSYDQPLNADYSNMVRNVYSTFNTNSNFSLGYQYNYLTRTRIDYVYSSISGQYNYRKDRSADEITKLISPNFAFNFGGSRKYYLKENKFFLEVAPSLGYNISESKKTIAGTVDTHSKNNSFNASIGLGAGLGRMERVSDLWQAYYILENLKEQKSFARELDEKDIFEFASFASQLKNKRFFDFRIRRIAELQSLDSLLHKQGLIQDSDISYFTTLNDYWSFANFPDRESGRVLKFWLSPQYSRYYYKSAGTNAQIYFTTILISNLSFNCTKQLNLFWDRRFNVLLSNETLINHSGSGYYPGNLFHSNVNFGYSYYPDSRTSISFLVGYRGEELAYQKEYDTYTKQWTNRIYTSLDAIYYFSPQLQLTGSFSFGYADKIYNNFKPTDMRYNLGLRYAIF
jgi:hypothetical protein